MIYTVTLNPALDRTLYVEGLKTEQPNRIHKEARYAGGKGIDVARALLAMGVPSIALGFIGGFDGKEFEGRLLNEGIACDFTRMSGEIRTNIIIQDESTEHETVLLAQGPEIQPVELMDFVEKLERLSGIDFLVISGSLPRGLTPTVYERMVRIGNNKGVRTLLDTSGEALSYGIRAHPTIIKPNRRELNELAGTELQDIPAIVRYCQTLQDRVSVILVSLGPGGIVMVESDRALHAKPPEVEVKSTIGAGDCAVAGFIKGLVSKESLSDCLRRAVASGTAATLNPGTGLCRCQDIDQLLPQVETETVNA